MKPECTLVVNEVVEGVLHVKAKTQYELTSTFMRVQEFYESPYKEIRGIYFTHERYMDICAYGNKRSAANEIVFSYLEDWNGFNVPGDVFEKWTKVFKGHLWEKEKELIECVNETKTTKKFYVIGTHDEANKGDIEHELSHAWYYLDSEYRKEQHKNLNKLSKRAREQIKDYLMGEGYRDTVIDDEAIAYLSTSLMPEIKDIFDKVRVPWTTVLKFQRTFDTYKDKKFED